MAASWLPATSVSGAPRATCAESAPCTFGWDAKMLTTLSSGALEGGSAERSKVSPFNTSSCSGWSATSAASAEPTGSRAASARCTSPTMQSGRSSMARGL
ncbi:MAG: hypothetical protein IPM35_19035 [Myxococcales bacterium]|nr:hypothetical protein [Myxococcales bacterium]